MTFGFFLVSFSLFGAIATAAFFLYGDSIKANIMNNFPESPLLYIAQGFVSIQVNQTYFLKFEKL